MKCGFFKMNIDPPVGIPIAGGYVPKYSIGSIDPLYVRTVAFSDGNRRALLVALDLCYMSTELHERCRNSIARAANIDPSAIIITCSHTHAGPQLTDCSWKIDFDTAPYIDELVMKVTVSARKAFEDLKEAKLFTAVGEAKGVNFIRRYKMKDGTVVTNPPKHDPNIDHPLGTPDERVKLTKIVREGARDIYLVGYGTHACMVGGYRTSADFPGVVCEMIEGALKDVECVFITSAQGDANHVDPFPSKEIEEITKLDLDNDSIYRARANLLGGAIAGEVLKIRMTAREIGSDGVFYTRRDMSIPANKDDSDYEEALKIVKIYDEGRANELPYKDMALTTVIANAKRIVRMKSAPDFFSYPMTAISVGGLVLVGMTGEPFTEIGRRVASASPFEFTMLACLSNCMTTYFPTSDAMREGGYEAVTSNIGIGADDIIVDTARDILAELRSKKDEKVEQF